jgi:hypothetical protein
LDAPAILSWLRDTFGDPARRNDLFGIIVHIADFLVAGLIVEATLRMALRRPRGRMEARTGGGLGLFCWHAPSLILRPLRGLWLRRMAPWR